MSSVVSALPGGFASRQRDYPNGEKLIFSFSGFSGVICLAMLPLPSMSKDLNLLPRLAQRLNVRSGSNEDCNHWTGKHR